MSSGQGRKLLLVEDNEVNREMLQRRLLRAGYTVVCRSDGNEVVAVTFSGTEVSKAAVALAFGSATQLWAPAAVA